MRINFNILIIFIPLNIFSQIDDKVFEFKNVRFDSLIVITKMSNSNDSWKDIYLFKNGLKTSERSYENEKLISFTKYFYQNKHLKKTENYSEIYSLDKNLKAVGEIKEGFYHGEEYIYENNQLSFTNYYDVIESRKNYYFEVQYQYDQNNRLTTEYHIDKHIGYKAEYKSNSKNLDSLFHKNTIEKSHKTYKHNKDSLVINYFKHGLFTGYKLYLSGFEHPKEIKTYSNLNELIDHIVYSRNEKNQVTNKVIKLITGKNVWGNNKDFTTLYNQVKFSYNKVGLPEKIMFYNGKELTSEVTFKYFTL